MINFRSRYTAVLVAIVMLVAGVGPAWAVGVRTGFLASNPQIFPVGDLVDLESIEGSEDFDWDTLPDIVFFEIYASTPEEMDREVIMNVNLRFGSQTLIDYWSSGFRLGNWIESPIGSNGYFTNKQLGRLKEEASDWLNENDVWPSSYAETDEFLSVLDGSLVSAGIAVIRINIYEHTGGDGRGALLATQTQTIQVYNPGIPQLQQPTEGEQISGYPIFFAWNWSGGTLLPSDVTLVVVEGNRNSDAESIMQSRNSANTRFEGTPQFGTSHTYTGLAGMEEALEEGKTYYWQVQVSAGTAVPGDSRVYESNIYSFVFTSEPGTGGGGGGSTGSGYIDPIVQQLQSLLPPELMAQITQELEGYEMDDILIDGVGGYQLQDLMQILAGLDPSLLSISLE